MAQRMREKVRRHLSHQSVTLAAHARRGLKIISRYINRGSSVLGCFLDASKAFHLVSHDLLFQKFVDCELPEPNVRFLSSWYSTHALTLQKLKCYLPLCGYFSFILL